MLGCVLQPEKMVDYKPWSDNLLQLRDDHWKHVRGQLSPTFSSGKLKKVSPPSVAFEIRAVLYALCCQIDTRAVLYMLCCQIEGEIHVLNMFCCQIQTRGVLYMLCFQTGMRTICCVVLSDWNENNMLCCAVRLE